VSLRIDTEPYDAVDAVFAREAAGDRSERHLAERLDPWLTQLDKHPIPASTRRRYLRPPGLWMITIPLPGDQDDWAILWDISGDDVWVRYAGHASFA